MGFVCVVVIFFTIALALCFGVRFRVGDASDVALEGDSGESSIAPFFFPIVFVAKGLMKIEGKWNDLLWERPQRKKPTGLAAGATGNALALDDGDVVFLWVVLGMCRQVVGRTHTYYAGADYDDVVLALMPP